MPRNTRSGKSELPSPPAAEQDEQETVPLEIDSNRDHQIDPRGRRRPPSLPEQHQHHDYQNHQLPAPSNSWWQRSGVQRLQQGHLCYSGAVIPCMVVITVILILLATKYEHLAEAAELALNATLLIVKTKAIH